MTEITEQQITKFTFSGHETFQCRHQWLKKGYDYIKAKNNFSDQSAVVALGVGKNMVSAISYWMKAFNLLDKKGNLTTFATYLLDDQGKDPYLEDEVSLWLLHYHIAKTGLATTYGLIFNDLRKKKLEFSKDQFITYVDRLTSEKKTASPAARTVANDFDIFVKMYKNTNANASEIEDTFSGLFADLLLLDSETRRNEDGKLETTYSIENKERLEIPAEVILYCLLSNESFDNTINLLDIETATNSPGTIFAINKEGIFNKIEQLVTEEKFKEYGITYSESAGIRMLQIKNKANPLSALNKYYDQ